MKLNLNGIEIELPNNAKVDVSKDGKSVKIDLPEAEVVERIRVVEVAGGSTERVIERIKVVEVEKPCPLQHYPSYSPTWPYTTTITYGLQGGSPNYQYGSTVVRNADISGNYVSFTNLQ
jgi:hypothetical protein